MSHLHGDAIPLPQGEGAGRQIRRAETEKSGVRITQTINHGKNQK
jgi:hypothetical protein